MFPGSDFKTSIFRRRQQNTSSYIHQYSFRNKLRCTDIYIQRCAVPADICIDVTRDTYSDVPVDTYSDVPADTCSDVPADTCSDVPRIHTVMYRQRHTLTYRQIHTVMYRQTTGSTATWEQTTVRRLSPLSRIGHQRIKMIASSQTRKKENVRAGAVQVSLFLQVHANLTHKIEQFHHWSVAYRHSRSLTCIFYLHW